MIQTITILLVGEEPFDIEAHVFGEWAAHKSVDHDNALRDDWWSVTLVPAGRRIRSAGQMTEAQAIELAQTLDARAPKMPRFIDDAHVERDVDWRRIVRTVRSIIFDVRGELVS